MNEQARKFLLLSYSSRVKSEANVTLDKVQACCIDRYTYAKWVTEPAIKQTNKRLEEIILQALRLKLADKESTAEKKVKHKARK
jgi:hypothetical protein